MIMTPSSGSDQRMRGRGQEPWARGLPFAAVDKAQTCRNDWFLVSSSHQGENPFGSFTWKTDNAETWENGKNCPLSKKEFSKSPSPCCSASPAPWHPDSLRRDPNREAAPTPLPETGCQHVPAVCPTHGQALGRSSGETQSFPEELTLWEGDGKVNRKVPKSSGELLVTLQHQDEPGSIHQTGSQAVRQVSSVTFKGWTGVSQRAAISIQTCFFKTGLWEENSLIEMTSPVSWCGPYRSKSIREGAPAQFAEWAPGGQVCVLSLLISLPVEHSVQYGCDGSVNG